MKPQLHKKTQGTTFQQTKLTHFYPDKHTSNMKDQHPQQTNNQTADHRHPSHLSSPTEKKSPNNTHQPQRRPPSNQVSSISARSNIPEVSVHKKEGLSSLSRVNVAFYLNKMTSQPYGEYIDKIHESWYHNYEKLERDHSFIQWIFPNSFQSRFNIHAKPLSKEEAEEFRTNPEIIRRYLKSYDMMLGFYGMKLKDKHTGELTRSRHPNFKERYYKTLVTSWHNHMRITRILCSLNETGFGRYAAELCKILKFEIHHPNGQMNALKKYNVYKEWALFEHYDESQQPINCYLKKINRKTEPHQVTSTLTVPKLDNLREDRSKSLEKSPARPRNGTLGKEHQKREDQKKQQEKEAHDKSEDSHK